MKDLFDGLSRVTDILNLGRLIFYTFAGALIVFPAYMIMKLVTERAGPDLAKASEGTTLGVLFISSVVVGFVVAAAAFPLVLDGLVADIRREVENPARTMSKYSFPGNYPLLRNKNGDDYAAWLISEYYRYVEIVTYVPLGAIIGLILTEVYLFIALLLDAMRAGNPGLTGNHLLFMVILAALVSIRYWLWPDVWVKRVVGPTIGTYLSAKRNLIEGLKTRPTQSDPAKPVAGPK